MLRYCVSLERLELNLCLDSTVDRAYPDSHAEHTQVRFHTVPPVGVLFR